MKINITPEVRAVLESSIIDATSVQLPSYPLARPLYVAVNKVLEAGGGEWNRRVKAHIFQSDPREILGLALTSNVIVDKAKALKKERQAFYTPASIAEAVAIQARVIGHIVLEPSAGHGALAKACAKWHAHTVECVESDAEACKALDKAGFAVRYEGDFLQFFPKSEVELYMRIVMNPPFTRKTDANHVRHAFTHWLKKDGLLTSIVCDDGQDRSDLALIDDSFQIVNRLPAGTFRESGTNIATLVIQFSK